ncbi:MAG TPA: DNA polymerase III subunit gamma/tau, partial [Segetibacter sp.]
LQEIAGKEEINAEKAALQVIAQKSEGCMRDSLSILDKIVSFTNGKLTYQNTLEHLNILDHDYFFKLLETQLEQDMAGSMLLYDEINRKGFEGDMVLNGFAEFIRNVLVSQNPRAASLLEVVEGLESEYVEAARKVSPAYLVSALNILNEAEINYKMARNKRLHVEMALIKLTFLQQAIELSFDNQTSALVKKKRVSGPVAVKFEAIQSMQIKQNPATKPAAPSNEKLYIETENSAGSAIAEPAPAIEKKQVKKEMVATLPKVVAATETATLPVVEKAKGQVTTKKTLLESLRDQHITNRVSENIKEAVAVTEDNLHEHWKCFTEKLKKQFKNSVVTVFNIAQLKVVNDAHFSVTVSTSLEQKFIEQEKLALLEYLKECFHNKNIGFTIHINEQEKDIVISENTLTTREKYQKIIEQYPMVKELKDRLKLELDY